MAYILLWTHEKVRMRYLFSFLLLGLSISPLPVMADAALWSSLREGAIFLVRHAHAPGVGDPEHFALGRCVTQRNLNEQGRDQARRSGEAFRAQNVRVERVLSSEWCRTRETAELAFGPHVQAEAAFNSFFETPELSAARTKEALDFLSAWQDGQRWVVVTHQVNITALTGITPRDGEGVVVRFHNGQLKVLGRLWPAPR
jgi:phosphohistidine phosphatase SixA